MLSANSLMSGLVLIDKIPPCMVDVEASKQACSWHLVLVVCCALSFLR
jgi:hypothetical protein